MTDRRLSTIALTAMAMVAFAANSVLCRMALREAVIDPATFSVVRFLSGAVMLVIVAARWQRLPAIMAGSWKAAFVLAFYALPFAFSYTQLSAGTGALILFGCVQVVMIVAALGSGERPHVLQWAGLGLALAGLVTLVFPGLTASSPESANAYGFTILFPLTFVSSAFVPVESMPSWLQPVAENNPFTTMVDAARALFIGTPAGNDVWLAFVWGLAITVVFAGLSIWRYRRAVAH